MPNLRCWAGPLDGVLVQRPGSRWSYSHDPRAALLTEAARKALPTTTPPIEEHVYALGPHPLLPAVRCWLYQSG